MDEPTLFTHIGTPTWRLTPLVRTRIIEYNTENKAAPRGIFRVEEQEQHGMRLIGQFRNRHRPDQFVWMRGFASMEARRKALEGFYFGPIWKEHRTAANDTMLDSDNVVLLKPARPASSFRLDPTHRPALDAPMTLGGVIIATVYSFEAPIDATFIDFFERQTKPLKQGKLFLDECL